MRRESTGFVMVFFRESNLQLKARNQNANLVGGLQHVLFFHLLRRMISTDDLHDFSEGWLNHQPATVKIVKA
jgi:hypothetical protein